MDSDLTQTSAHLLYPHANIHHVSSCFNAICPSYRLYWARGTHGDDLSSLGASPGRPAERCPWLPFSSARLSRPARDAFHRLFATRSEWITLMSQMITKPEVSKTPQLRSINLIEIKNKKTATQLQHRLCCLPHLKSASKILPADRIPTHTQWKLLDLEAALADLVLALTWCQFHPLKCAIWCGVFTVYVFICFVSKCSP